MGSSKLPLPEKNARLRTGTRPADSSAGPGRAPGNRELLSRLGPAKAMPAPLQERMEQTLQADFSGVRLYESPIVARHGAEAAASGNGVAFAPGRLNLSSREGIALLGHELSHVRSQSRGEAAGGGFLHSPALERRADEDGARAMQAFDSLSGQTLAPLSASAPPLSAEGPVQAKKNKSPGEKLKEAYADLSTPEQVSTLRKLALSSMYLQKKEFMERGDDGRLHVQNELERENPQLYQDMVSEDDAYHELLGTVDEGFMEELYSQQMLAVQEANEQWEAFRGGGDGAADFHTKYSEAGMQLEGIRQLLYDLGINGNDRSNELMENYLGRIGGAQQSDPQLRAMMERTQGAVQSSDDGNGWVQFMLSPSGNSSVIENRRSLYERSLANHATGWTRPKKEGFFQRLFGRRSRGRR